MRRNNMSVSQWHMHRLGLVDFWCYDNDEFYFSDGHMLLRGSNGSGKSVTMQSFIPLLLDGNKSSERLDPFGTRSRKMDTYLIDENSERDERIGYLYLEFKREESDIYKTIGMGLRARKNRPLDSWYFVIEDNRRVNIDFSLIDNHLTLSQKQLENILGTQVIHSQNEYMRKVNDALFGFSNIDDYKDAIDLLLQLRSPKLSNSLSPSKINEILATSLQPLSEDDLRPMSDAITSMDNLQDELENLQISLQAASKIKQAYDIYNQAILIDKWNKYNRENDSFKKINQEIIDLNHSIQQKNQEYLELQQSLSQNQIQLEVSQKEKSVLIDPNMERLHEELLTLKQHIQDEQTQVSHKQNQYDNKKDQIVDLKNNIDDLQNQIYDNEKTIKASFNLLDETYASFPFSEHIALKQALLNHQPFEFEYTKKCLKEEKKKTEKVLSLFQLYQQKNDYILTLEDEMIQYHDQMNQVQLSLENAQKAYQQCIVEYQEFFYKYAQDNQILKLSQEQLLEMTNILKDYELNHDYHSLEHIVYQQYTNNYENLLKEKGELSLELEKVCTSYEKVLLSYQQWKDKKDYEPTRDELTIQHRQYLDQQHIPYIPFFQLLDFEETVEENAKNRIEELLSQMHILDAIVVEKKYYDQIISSKQGHDYYLWTDINLESLHPVKITTPFDASSLTSLFNRLGIESQDIYIEENYFHSGVLQGTIDQNQVSCLIGFQRRAQVRQQKLIELSKEIDDLSQQKDHLQQKIVLMDKKIDILKKEYNSFIKENQLKEQYQSIETYQKDYQYLENKIDNLLKQRDEEKQKLQNLMNQIQQHCHQLMLDPTKEALQLRQDAIETYELHIDSLKDGIQNYQHHQQLRSIVQEKLDDLITDTDTLFYEIEKIQHQINVDQGKISFIEKELDKSGFKDKQHQLELIEDKMKQLQNDIQNMIKQISKIETELSFNQEQLHHFQEQLEQQKIKKDQYDEVLLQDVHYHFLFQEDDNIENHLRQLGQHVKMNKSVSEYLGTLQSVFFEQVSYLSSYHLTYEVDTLPYDLEDIQGHFLIKANPQGKKIPFLDLIDILKSKIDSQKMLIEKQDREIFEEILVNTIGKKIRNRIQASQRWVDKMERYMKDMNTSSGLQLGLKWRSKKALDDDELDTQRLVALLEKDYRILKESDRQKISQHFRGKIAKARRLSLDENTTSSFHQLIKEVMDYRKWFEFVLYVQKPNENKKELTNRIFYAFSGGEKAIAMYVPLFSAVAAKFESAMDDAPHLIALDEAFAGVDENNIDNLFALITKFNFDYIMNSQVLWGDYPSCKSLSIYELYRPQNAPFVTKVAYHWNGHVKKVQFK